ncbi:unnamed protein product [Moneuplotes crassus]|uniref:Uncharacterized protein n=1 Tax=Euplotes crassus TaxID=5936 RepID=A0AAD1UMK4_EUPCR|nr:unnamed protein product [Moneuplotes crassus]
MKKRGAFLVGILGVVLALVMGDVEGRVFLKEEYSQVPMEDMWVTPKKIKVEPLEIKENGMIIEVSEQGEIECNTDDKLKKFAKPSYTCWGLKLEESGKYYALATDQFEYSYLDSQGDLYVEFVGDLPLNASGKGVSYGQAQVKLLGDGFDPDTFNQDTPYWLKFGPKRRGTDTKIELEITWKGKRGTWKLEKSPPTNRPGFLYTLALKQDGTYSIYLDLQPFVEGKIEKDFEFSAIDGPEINEIIGAGFETYMVGNSINTGFLLVTNDFQDTQDYGKYIKEHLTYRNNLFIEIAMSKPNGEGFKMPPIPEEEMKNKEPQKTPEKGKKKEQKKKKIFSKVKVDPNAGQASKKEDL